MKIACLHTAESNVAVFESAASALAIPAGALQHFVRPEFLSDAERAGGLTPEIEQEASEALIALAGDADIVILTCSTIGPAVVSAGKAVSVPVLRVDAALAEKAVEAGGKVVVLCAVETTVPPTRAIFEAVAKGRDVSIDVRLVHGAWARFRAGDREGYLSDIATAAEAAYREGAAVVALAQASMAGAADLFEIGRRPLSSPIAGLASALAKLPQTA